MLKESTRKGWAGVLAGALALAGLSVGAAPAAAAPTSINISPISGTNTNALAGAYFVLKTNAPGDSQTDDIRYQIEGATASSFDEVLVIATTDITAGGNTSFGDVTADIQTKDADDKITVIDPDGVNTASADAIWQDGQYQLLALKANVTSKTTVTITPFLEDTIDGVISTGEVTGDPITVTFHPASTLEATTTLSLGAIGDNSHDAVINFNGPNMASIQEESDAEGLGLVKFTKNGATSDVISIDASNYSASDGAFKVTLGTGSNSNSLDAADVLVAASKILSESYDDGNLKIQADSDSASMDANLSFSPQVGVDSTGGGSGADIRGEDGSITITANLNAKDGKSPAGETVTFKIAETDDVSLGGSVAAGGETLTNANSSSTESISVTAVTDADGDASVTVSYEGLDEGDQFSVTATANVAGNSSAAATFTAKDPVPTTVVNNDRTGGAMYVEAGSTTSYGVTLVDQFGIVYDAAPTKLRYDYNGNSGITSTSSNGVHSISLTDNNIDDQSETLSVSSYDITTGSAKTDDAALSNALSVPVEVVEDKGTVSRVVISGESSNDKGNSEDIAGTLVAFDSEFTAGDLSPATDHSFDVTVYSTTGSVLPGQVLTVTAPSDVLLGDGTRQAFGSLQVRTDQNGAASIVYDSNSNAKKTITVTAGSASDTTFFDFGPISAHSKVANIDISGPSSVAAGATAKFVATLTDKYGNPVDTTADATGDNFLFSYSGPGLEVGSQPTQTGSDGTATISVLMGSNESGTATVTLRTDTDGSSATLTGRQTVSKSVTVGAATGTFTGTYGDVYAWTVDQGDGTAKVYVKFPTVGDKVRIGHQTGGSGSYETIYVKTTTSETMDGLRQVAGVGTYVVRTIDLESGTNRIRVDVGDDRLVQVRYNQ